MRLSSDVWGSGPQEFGISEGHRDFTVLSGESLSSLTALSSCGCPGCLASLERKLAIASTAPGGDDARTDGGGGLAFDETAGVDSVGNTTGTASTLAIGASTNGFVNTAGDRDWYAVTMVAGQSYTFTLDGGTLGDPYVEIYNQFGTLIGYDDDFGSGINSALRWTATETGTYYINAQAFPDSGLTGSYTLSAETSAPASPLDSIDYHYTMPTTNISIWFSTPGYTNPSGDSTLRSWTQQEIDGVMAALATYTAIAPLNFSIAANQGAATWIFTLTDLPGNTLGYFAVGSQYAAFDPTVPDFTAGLTAGGNSWVTIIHEAGHGLGMAHPHDNGAENYGPDNSEVMQGVIDPFESFGTFNMNQGVFTTMTYNDGWRTSGFGGPPSNLVGGQATPMALDVALMQQRYGINPTTGAGNTSYTLALAHSAYRSIWDVGGTDTISYAGSGNATIDLRAATLLNEVGGGGYVSFVQGVHGGWTIANGVLIENATGGSGNDTLIGNAANNILTGGAGIDNMSGGLGDDTYYVDNASDVVTEGVGAGTDIVFASTTHNLFANVENLTLVGTGSEIHGNGNTLDNTIIGDGAVNGLQGLGGNDTLIGNGGNDILVGGAGNDILDGGIGNDNMSGGTENDTYYVDSDSDTVTEALNAGTDTVRTTLAAYTLAANVENLILDTGAVDGTGNELANTITGNSTNNILDGGLGADTMIGGNGDDTYIVDDAGDVTTEGSALGGTDTVQSSVTRSLTANIEHLTLTGVDAINGFGNALNNVINGNGAANQLNGFDGADILFGGAGADNMFGGNGDDAYYVDNAGDQTTEVSALGGTDIVYSSVARNLTAHIENLTLFGSGNIAGSGNTLNNIITGNTGANTLYGFEGNDRLDGGTGADTMFGAAGDDVYVVDNAGDITVEGISGPAGGIDTIETFISRNMNANFENMILLGSATIAYGNVLGNVLTGNGLANSLYGFEGNDTLDGGAGADSMFGADGDDTYIVDNAGDVTSEVSALGGTDTVISSVERNLTANLENLTLSGSANINGAGNALNNIIIGNSGVNTLFGLAGDDTLDGGLGADTLQGGANADTYAFTTALGGGNVDAIVGFSVADDTIYLNNAVFTGLATGALAAGAFVIGAAAADADDRIIYNSATGQLFFDADGNDVGAAVLFATLTAGLSLTSADFIVGGP